MWLLIDCLIVFLLAWLQDLQQLTISTEWSQNSQEERNHFIPPYQGLLTTRDNQAPLQAPQQNRPFEKAVPIIQGLKLFHLPPPQSSPAPVREAWAPNQNKPTMYRKSENYKKPTGQPPQWNQNQDSTQTQAYTSLGRGRERKAVRLPPAPNVAVADTGLPLLRLPSNIQMRSIQLPQVPLSAPIRLHTAGTATTRNFHEPQLLHVEPEPSCTVSTTHHPSYSRDWLFHIRFWMHCGSIIVDSLTKKYCNCISKDMDKK